MLSSTRFVAYGATVAALALAATLGVTLDARQATPQVVPGTNVNMVSGTSFPDGDPYLQRQNEPSARPSRRAIRCTCSPAPTTTARVDLPGPVRSDARREDERRRLGRRCSSRSTAARPGRARCCPAIRRTPRRTGWHRRSRAGRRRPIRSCAPAPTGCSTTPAWRSIAASTSRARSSWRGTWT